MKDSTKWIRTLFTVVFIFCFLNFLVLMIQTNGTIGISNGKYVIENHGTVLKEISSSEYMRLKSYESRVLSCICLVLSVLPMTIFYSQLKRKNL